jgi:N-acyl-D-aspartate/D-glutamate deacylase
VFPRSTLRVTASPQLEGAELFGLAGRGLLAPGAFADVNVIDLEGLRLRTPELLADFPWPPAASSSGRTATTTRSSTGRCSSITTS